MGRFSACGGGTIEITCPDKDVAHAIYKAIEDLIYTAKERMMNSNQNQVRSEKATILAGNSNPLPMYVCDLLRRPPPPSTGTPPPCGLPTPPEAAATTVPRAVRRQGTSTGRGRSPAQRSTR